MMSKYVRITKGVKDYGKLVKASEIQSLIDSDADYYQSTYNYTEEHLAAFKKSGTVKGIKNLTTNKLWWDFDSINSINVAQHDAQTLVKRLQENFPDESIDVYFSGNKGFTVEVLIENDLNRKQVEYLAIEKYGNGLDTLDTSMYDYNQIFRVPNTKHPKSGLYKKQLTIKQLMSSDVETIRNDAKVIRKLDQKVSIDVPAEFLLIPKPSKLPITQKLQFDIDKRPLGWKDYKWALVNAYMLKPNERHEALMVVAATYRGMGFDRQMTRSLCLGFDEKYQQVTGEPAVDDLDDNILPSVFSKHWEGGQYSFKNNKWLQGYCERIKINVLQDDDDDVINIYDVKDQYIHFVKHIEENTIKTGIKRLDDALPITVGMNLGIVGAASSGKTAIALEILKNTSEAGVISVFASLDMHRNRLFEKLLYKVSNLPRAELYKLIQEDKAEHIMNLVRKEYKNVWFYDRSCPSVGDIRSYIRKVEEKTGQKVKLVMLDYFERVNAEKSDDTAASKEVAGQLQDIVNDFNVAMVTLVQPNKFSLAGGPDSPITNYTAIKGSSFLYQSFRSIISIWRPFFTPETKDDDKYLSMAILKNDLGELGLFNFNWDGRKGEITEFVSDEEESYFQALLKEKTNKKNNDKDDQF